MPNFFDLLLSIPDSVLNWTAWILVAILAYLVISVLYCQVQLWRSK